MILIISHREDYTTDYLVNKLNKKEIKYLRLNTDAIGITHNITFNNRINNSVSIDDYSEFTSVWFRRTKYPNIEFGTIEETDFFQHDFKVFLHNLWNTIDAKKWLSFPDNIYKSENKLYQLQIAEQLGFKTAATIVSSDKKAIKNFYFKHGKRIIVKPLCRSRFREDEQEKLIFTNQVLDTHIGHLDKYNSFPAIFQEEVSKEYEIRVTVVNGKVFSAKVESQNHEETKIDWRKKRIRFKKHNLPEEIEEKCIELVKKLALNFGAIDLIKNNEGYIFLEINPNGQWVWIEADTGLQISNAIIEFLK